MKESRSGDFRPFNQLLDVTIRSIGTTERDALHGWDPPWSQIAGYSYTTRVAHGVNQFTSLEVDPLLSGARGAALAGALSRSLRPWFPPTGRRFA
jgi:hypothetical protein